MFIAVRMVIKVQNTDVKKEKKLAPPLFAVTFLPNITHPLASAKSAIDQSAKKTNVISDKI